MSQVGSSGSRFSPRAFAWVVFVAPFALAACAATDDTASAPPAGDGGSPIEEYGSGGAPASGPTSAASGGYAGGAGGMAPSGSGGSSVGAPGGAGQGAGGSAAQGGSVSAPYDAGAVVQPSDGSGVRPVTGYLHTEGSKILDASGKEVHLTGLSWFGLETSNYAPHGLWTRSMASMLDQIASLGYNSIRVPFSSQLFDAGSTPNSIDANANPDLVGKSGIEILDALIHGAGTRGLKIILDRHRPDSGGQSELWYTDQYSEARWISDWKMLAARYENDPTVIGFDLHNEPHGTATWGDGNAATDWRAAAERAGDAVLGVNPQLLIIVEGIETYNGTSTWWGGNLRGAQAHPVNLSVAGRLVYSPHEYPASVYAQPWFSDANYPNNLPGVWNASWGYLAADGIAPVWIGEFGTKLQTDSDKQWIGALAHYIQSEDLSFSYWCWNPDSGDTGGILADDWVTVNQDKQNILQPLLAAPIE